MERHATFHNILYNLFVWKKWELFRSTSRMMEGIGPCKAEFKPLCVQDARLIIFSWRWLSPLNTSQPLNLWESQLTLGRPSSTTVSWCICWVTHGHGARWKSIPNCPIVHHLHFKVQMQVISLFHPSTGLHPQWLFCVASDKQQSSSGESGL